MDVGLLAAKLVVITEVVLLNALLGVIQGFVKDLVFIIVKVVFICVI